MSKVSIALTCFFIVCAYSPMAHSQSPNTQDNSGIQPFQTYSQDKESINLATGGLGIRIPVLHLSGRAGHDLDLAFSYNNQSILSIGMDGHPVPGAPGGNGQPAPGVTQTVMGWNASSNYGWTLNLPSVGFGVYNSVQSPTDPQTNGACRGAATVSDADGREMMFGLAMFGCSSGAATNTQQYGVSFTTAADDQGNDVIADIGAAAGPTFFFPDGHRLLLPAAPTGQNLQELFPTTYYDLDRNGNTITYIADNALNPTKNTITDTLGRQVTVHWLNSSIVSGPSSITYSNSAGNTETIQFIYGAAPNVPDGTLDQPGILYPSTAGYGLADYNSNPGTIYIQYVGFNGAGPTINVAKKPVSAIILPNGQTYTFQYDAYGDLTKITYPNGGYSRYDYQKELHASAQLMSNAQQTFEQDVMQVVAKHVCASAVTPMGATVAVAGNNCPLTEETTTYTSSASTSGSSNPNIFTGNSTMSVMTPDGTTTLTTYAPVIPRPPPTYSGALLSAYQASPELSETITSASGTTLRFVLNTYDVDHAHLKSRSTWRDDGSSTTEQWTYQQTPLTGTNFTQFVLPGQGSAPSPNAVLCSGYCNYTQAATGSTPYSVIWNLANYTIADTNGLILKTVTDTWNIPFFDPSKPFIPAQKLTENVYQGSSSNLLASTQFTYDDYSSYPLTTSGAVQHGLPTLSFSSTMTARGNITKVQKWRNTDNQWIASSSQYDDAGNKVRDIDPNGNPTFYSYADNWQNSACAPASAGAVAYPTTVTNALGQAVSTIYNSCTGKPAASTDANGQSTSYTYDAFDRVTDVVYPETDPSSGINAETKTCYSDTGCQGASAASNYVLVSSRINASIWKVDETDLDGLGRKISSKLLSDPYGMIEADTSYDTMERVYSVSAPYRPSSGGPSSTTTYLYDGLGRRVLETVMPGNQFQQTQYSGLTMVTIDETNRQWTHINDPLSRLVEVLEPDPSNSDTLATQYQYDAIGNLLRVDQWGGPIGSSGDRVRTFTYDTLSHLLTSYNPEAGNICYGTRTAGNCSPAYDFAGNLRSKTDDRGVVTTFSVDVLNRVTGRSYSDGTPSACFQFNNATNNSGIKSVGRLLFEWTQNGSCPASASSVPQGALNYRIVNSYDADGHILNETQCPVAPCALPYTFPYAYDLASNTVGWSQGAPGTPSLSSTVDSAGRLSNVTSTWNDATHPGILFRADATTSQNRGTPYGPFGLQQAETAISSSSNTPALLTSRAYDTRGRVLSEIDTSAIPGSPAQQSSGQFTFTFQEPPPQTSGGSPSTGQFTIGGSDSHVPPCPDPSLAPGCLDYGVLVFVVYGVPNVGASVYNVYYSNGDTAGTLASDTASMINNDPSGAVSATVSGGTISLTSLAGGAGASYGLASQVVDITTQQTSSTLDNGSSFTITQSGQSMTGDAGGGGSLVYDSGTLSFALGQTSVTVPWNQASSPASIASAVATSLSQTGNYTASSSGGTLQVASVAAGSAQNVYASFNLTHNQASFTGTSVQVQGAGLTGGRDARNAIYSFSIPSDTTGYAANGNLINVNDSVMGNWTYSYDELNRLKTAVSPGGPFAATYLSWTYDPWGNRLAQAVYPGSGSQPLPQSTSKNFDSSNHVTFSSYPSAVNGFGYGVGGGFITSDVQNNYTYDGDGRLCSAQNASTGVVTGYTYDAEGIRVSKGSQTSPNCLGNNGFVRNAMYLVGLGGEQVSELDGSGNWKHSNVFAHGALIATYDQLGTHFHYADILGSRRVQASSSGAVEETCTSLPFGDGLNCVQTAVPTANDATEQHFTGKERDTESGLDYFGARYYSSGNGIFISSDWSSSTVPVPYADIKNPQSLNLYSYVENNPVTRNDLTGHVTNNISQAQLVCPSDPCESLQGEGQAPAGDGSGKSTSQERKETEGDQNKRVVKKKTSDADQQQGSTDNPTPDRGGRVKPRPDGQPPIPIAPGKDGGANEWEKVPGSAEGPYGPRWQPKSPTDGPQPSAWWDAKDGVWSGVKGDGSPRDHYDRWGNKINHQVAPKHIVLGMTLGAGAYVTYRIIRLLPSLTPFTLETLPLNLALP